MFQSLLVVLAILLADDGAQTLQLARESYGAVLVDEVVAVETDYAFRCQIRQWPAVIGDNIAVVVHGIAGPSIDQLGGSTVDVDQFKSHVRQRMAELLSQAESITLKQIRRGKEFCIVADVFLDDSSLAELLVAQGLARSTEEEPVYQPPVEVVILPLQVSGTRQSSDSLPQRQTHRAAPVEQKEDAYVASKNSKIFHRSTCRFVKTISQNNRVTFSNADEAKATGRRPCSVCDP